jgi:hypothetical protein
MQLAKAKEKLESQGSNLLKEEKENYRKIKEFIKSEI